MHFLNQRAEFMLLELNLLLICQSPKVLQDLSGFVGFFLKKV